MRYAPLHEILPEVAAKETRAITVTSGTKIPHGEYGLVEYYCLTPGCDCRRVMLHVFSAVENEVVAVVNFGWESKGYYEKWLGRKDDNVISDLKGPRLNSTAKQSPYANALLNFIRDVLLKDKTYVNRLKSHYRLYKEKIQT
jgi:hypothetical protein